MLLYLEALFCYTAKIVPVYPWKMLMVLGMLFVGLRLWTCLLNSYILPAIWLFTSIGYIINTAVEDHPDMRKKIKQSR